MEELVFLREKVSEAAAKTEISFAPAARACSRPFRLGTRTGYDTPGTRRICPSTAAVSAIWGTQRGDTKLPASTVLKPARDRRSINSTFVATSTARASF